MTAFPGLWALCIAIALIPVTTASAQDATAPERITEGFGAWEVRCQRSVPADAASALGCEMVQATTVQGDALPVSQIAVGRTAPDAGLTAVIQLPLGLWLPSGAVLDLGSAGGTHAITILRCLPAGCIGQLGLTDSIRTALSDETQTNSALQFEMQVGSPARVPVVHQGFAAALAALEQRLSAP